MKIIETNTFTFQQTNSDVKLTSQQISAMESLYHKMLDNILLTAVFEARIKLKDCETVLGSLKDYVLCLKQDPNGKKWVGIFSDKNNKELITFTTLLGQ